MFTSEILEAAAEHLNRTNKLNPRFFCVVRSAYAAIGIVAKIVKDGSWACFNA